MKLTDMKYTPASRGHNRFCGPGALSILLQVDTATAAAALRQWRRDHGWPRKAKAIRGTYDREMIDVLIMHGKNVYRHWDTNMTIAWMKDGNPAAPTVNQWMDHIGSDGVYLVSAGRHWFVIVKRGNRRYYCDNQIGEWVNARRDERVRRRARIQTAYRVVDA